MDKRWSIVVLSKLADETVSEEGANLCNEAIKEINAINYSIENTIALVQKINRITLDAVRSSSIADINSAKTNASYAIAKKAITDIKAADTIESITAIKTTALANMKKADEDAAYAKALSEAKDEALETVENAIESAISDNAKEVSVYAIFNAATLEEVASAKEEALNAIAAAENELADAKTAAIAAINAEAGENASDAIKTIVSESITNINAQTNVNKVNKLKDEAIELIKARKDAESSSENCNHLCHKKGFLGFIWKIANFFNKLFKINKTCACNAKHW